MQSENRRECVGGVADTQTVSQPTPYALAQGLMPSPSRCFLCGGQVDDSNDTKEHVFPKWLLNRFDLWDERLTLLNGTTIKYGQLVIPCCQPCNNQHLSILENRVQQAFARGVEAVGALEPSDLYLWIVKIYYGLLFRNLTLPLDRRTAEEGPIFTTEDLSRFRFLHLMLQGIRGIDVRIRNAGTPGSCVIAPAQTSTLGHRSLNWDYFDVPHAPFLAVRVGSVAIFAGMADFGAFLHFAKDTPHFDAMRHLQLHPEQFQEFASLCASIAMWVSYEPDYQVDEDGPNLTLVFDETTATSHIPMFMHEPRFFELWAATANVRGATDARVGRMPTLLLDENEQPRHMSMDEDVAEGRFLPGSAARRSHSGGK